MGFVVMVLKVWTHPISTEIIIFYRHPKLILGGRALVVMFGFGRTTGNTFFARSTTGFSLNFASASAVAKETGFNIVY